MFVQFDKNTLTDQALELLSLVPEGYIPLPHQIGGHRHVDGKLGEGGREGGEGRGGEGRVEARGLRKRVKEREWRGERKGREGLSERAKTILN